VPRSRPAYAKIDFERRRIDLLLDLSEPLRAGASPSPPRAITELSGCLAAVRRSVL
jgi:hypothetical protein